MEKRYKDVELEKRKKNYRKVSALKDCEGCVPVICEPSKGCSYDLPEMKTLNLLVKEDMEFPQLQMHIRKKLEKRITSKDALFFTVNDKMPSSKQTIRQIYNNEKDEDGFLYVYYTPENTFG